MAKRATRGSAFQYAVFGRTQISVQQKSSTKAIVLRKTLRNRITDQPETAWEPKDRFPSAYSEFCGGALRCSGPN